MDADERKLEFPERDPLREYSEAEQRRLTENLMGLYAEIDAGAFVGEPFVSALISRFHRRIFEGVRSFAGRQRAPAHGEIHLTFGPHRSLHRDDVPGEIERICDRVRRSVASLHDNPDDPDYERSAYHIAVWAQAEVIRVHPFSDGNGRTGRALTDHLLVLLGFDPVPVHACRQEYIGVLNAYFRGRAPIDNIVDLYLRLATGG